MRHMPAAVARRCAVTMYAVMRRAQCAQCRNSSRRVVRRRCSAAACDAVMPARALPTMRRCRRDVIYEFDIECLSAPPLSAAQELRQPREAARRSPTHKHARCVSTAQLHDSERKHARLPMPPTPSPGLPLAWRRHARLERTLSMLSTPVIRAR